MKIEVYTKSGCTHCVQAKQLLEAKSLPYTSYKLKESEAEYGDNLVTRKQLMEIFPNARTMPQILIDGEAIGGLTELRDRLKQLNV